MNDFPHYFKKLPPGCTHVDVYRVLDLFGVVDPPIQHAVKKLLCAGERGNKTMPQDIAEAIATLQRWQQMREEEQPPPDLRDAVADIREIFENDATAFDISNAPDLWTSQPAPSAAPERRKAPWPDYAGNPIHEGDWIVHPSGARARVVFDPSATHSPGWSEWRCDYAGDPSSYALAHQIGDLGRAVVEKPAPAPEDAERAAYLKRWKDAPEWARFLSQDRSARCEWWAVMPRLDLCFSLWRMQKYDNHGSAPAPINLLGSVRCEPRPTPAGGQGVQS